MNSVLVSSCGCGNGYAMLSSLQKNFPDVTAIGTDINPPHLNASSVLCDHYLQSPMIESDRFCDFMTDVIGRFKPLAYFAFIDAEFDKVINLCRDKNVALSGIIDSKFESDKFKYISRLSTLVQTPKSSASERFIWGSEYYIIKPRKGNGSRGIRIVKRADIGLAPGEFVQEYLDGTEYTVDCLYDHHNDVCHTTVRQRIEVRSGVCIKAKIFFSDEVSLICGKICRALGLCGGLCIQFIKAHDRWYVIDVNPRLGAGSALSTAIGNDYFSAAIAYSLGRDYQHFFTAPRDNDRYVVRQYQEIVTE